MPSPEIFFDLQGFAHRSLWKEGAPVWAALAVLSDYLKGRANGAIEAEIPQGAYLERPESISIGAGTVVEPGVYIKGPCILGKNCVVRHGAYLRGEVLCGDGCVIGHGVEVRRSIFLEGAKASHLAYVGDSILGNRVNLGAGVKCANLRLDRKEVLFSFEGKKFATGLEKFGAVLGDGVQIGCNCVLNPGSAVGKGSVSYPLLNLGGYIPAGFLIKKEGLLEALGPKILDKLISESLSPS